MTRLRAGTAWDMTSKVRPSDSDVATLGSAAECITTDGPMSEGTENIQYSAADDAIIDQWLREASLVNWYTSSSRLLIKRERWA